MFACDEMPRARNNFLSIRSAKIAVTIEVVAGLEWF